MPRPNSILTKIRVFVIDRIQPFPDKGEAWCVNCSSNHGKTLVIPLESVKKHVASNHHPLEHVRMWGAKGL